MPVTRIPVPDGNHLGVACLLLEAAGEVRWSNAAASELTAPPGNSPRTLSELVHAEDRSEVATMLTLVAAKGRAAGVVRVRDAQNGGQKYLQIILVLADGGEAGIRLARDWTAEPPGLPVPEYGFVPVGGVFVQAWDVTSLVLYQRELEAEVLTDLLPGVPNLRMFLILLSQELLTSSRSRPPTAVFYAAVDDFDQVNDVHGRQIGNGVLVELAKRWQGQLRDDDTLARIGGDEFALICSNLKDWAAAFTIVDRLRAAATEPIATSAGDVHVSVSMGVAFAEESSDRPGAAATLLALAGARVLRSEAHQVGRPQSVEHVNPG
jgi:diguanylate cyclase (GGDEF)-like protein